MQCERRANDRAQSSTGYRRLKVLGCPGPHQLDGGGDVRIASQHYDRKLQPACAYRRQQIAYPQPAEVGRHDDAPACIRRDALKEILRGHERADVVGLTRKHSGKRPGLVARWVDDEYRSDHGPTGDAGPATPSRRRDSVPRIAAGSLSWCAKHVARTRSRQYRQTRRSPASRSADSAPGQRKTTARGVRRPGARAPRPTARRACRIAVNMFRRPASATGGSSDTRPSNRSGIRTAGNTQATCRISRMRTSPASARTPCRRASALRCCPADTRDRRSGRRRRRCRRARSRPPCPSFQVAAGAR